MQLRKHRFSQLAYLCVRTSFPRLRIKTETSRDHRMACVGLLKFAEPTVAWGVIAFFQGRHIY